MADLTHSIVPGSKRITLPGAHALGPVDPGKTLIVTLKLRRKQELPELDGRPAKALTRDELAATYGGSEQDADAVADAFRPFGLTVAAKNSRTRTVELSGTVGQVEKAFQLKLFDYAHSSGNYRGRVGEVRVPAAVEKLVQGVFGLDNRRVAHRRRHPTREAGSAGHPKQPGQVPAPYLPDKLAAHYNFPDSKGNGQTVGILEFGGGYSPNDLQHFCTIAMIDLPNVTTVSVDGTPVDAKDGAEGEVMLDVEVVAGVCPQASIVLYFAAFTEQGWIAALDAVVQDKANDPGTLSISWGYAEDAYIWTKQAMVQVNESLKEAALLGITVCVAAGDDGSSDGITDGLAHVDFPASSPYVLAVGGTTVKSPDMTVVDVCWHEGSGVRPNGGSTGGGVSAVFPRPDWQRAIAIEPVNPGAIRGRCVPDLAANADWTASPYLLVVDGGVQPNGGTSAATPLVASLVTRINALRPAGDRVGYLTPVLYQAAPGGQTIGATVCTDVVAGDNVTDQTGGYAAGDGYDAVTGWGTPNGVALMNALPVGASAAQTRVAA